jgi:glycosyltransferase involved in cell wall biosynthesis
LIVVYHKNNRISKVVSAENKMISFDKSGTIASGLLQLATAFPKSKIVWCDEVCQEHLNLKHVELLFHHDKMMLSYSPGESAYFGRKIGYVEESPFIAINKKVLYPTWQMSSLVGVIHASLLLKIKGRIKSDNDFDYYLNSVAKVCMPLGLLCYSEPKLLTKTPVFDSKKASVLTLFKFVKQHHKTRWVWLLFLNLLIYERSFPILAFLNSTFFKSRNKKSIHLDALAVNSSSKVVDKESLDVIIPTIGRKEYLLNVLKDLAQQTHLPVNVIIVEQNPSEHSVSELDYLTNQTWPFVIKHTFTHQMGVCNARNLALKQTESEWVFLADDDICITNYFIENALDCISKYENKAFTFSCLQENEKIVYEKIIQWSTFGSGCSIVNVSAVQNIKFNVKYEFGFGEDADFGMQLRNQGIDILYLPKPEILHFKAPMGGFRTKPVFAWDKDSIQPKPSPTVQLYKILHLSQEQQKGYQMTLFFKFYTKQSFKNPLRYYFNFRKQWGQSVFWANKLKERS